MPPVMPAMHDTMPQFSKTNVSPRPTPREVAAPLEDRLAQEAGAQLDQRDREDDRVRQQALDHLERRFRVAVVALATRRRGRSRVARPRPACRARTGSDSTKNTEQDPAGIEEQPLEVVGTRRVISLPDVVGEVEAERDQDAEDAAERAALAQVEPRRVDLDDRDRAEALEVHVRARTGATNARRRATAERACSVDGHVAHQRGSRRAEPAAAIRIVVRPPQRSVSGPLSRNATP